MFHRVTNSVEVSPAGLNDTTLVGQQAPYIPEANPR